MNTTEIKKMLKGEYRGFADDYRSACDASRNRALANLKQGQPAPSEGILHDTQGREEFSAKASQRRHHVQEILDGAMKEIRKVQASAPSEEAVRFLSMMSLKSSVTEEELVAAAESFGDNPMAAGVIYDLAQKNHIPGFEQHPVYEIAEDLETARRSLTNSMSVVSAEQTGVSDGRVAMMDMVLDAIPDADI